MENASQALLIAGGIFLVIVIITLGVYMFGSLHNFSNMQDQQTAQQQIASFNKSFEAYNKSVMYGTDLISVMNKANENNRLHNESIEIRFKFKQTVIYEKYDENTGKRKRVEDKEFRGGQQYTSSDFESEIKNSVGFDDFKRRIFKCVYVGYDNKTGRINLMEFEEVELNDYEHK